MTYRIPSMAEVRALSRPDSPIVVSTFSGCGGSCLGFRMAGFRVAWANEFVPAARETYHANFPEVPLDENDIRKVHVQTILAAAKTHVGDVDVLEGSPPCASFSTAGRREEYWGEKKKYSDKTQRVDDLFFEYARILNGLQPKMFVAENVSGLGIGVAKGYFKDIFLSLEECGYVVECRLLDAQWLGVPQMRRRLIFQGVRKDLGEKPRWPTPFERQVTFREAVEGLTPNAEIEDPEERGPSLEGYSIGPRWERLDEGVASADRFNLIRSAWDKPVQTIVQMGGIPGSASVTHPSEKRKLSIPELRRLCSFPDDFVVTGRYKRRYERFGRAVPPLMMKAVATCVRETLDAVARSGVNASLFPPEAEKGGVQDAAGE